MLIAGRFENLRGVGIDDEGAPCLLGCAVDRNDAVNVLRRAGDQHHARCGLEAINKRALQRLLSRKAPIVVKPPEARSLHQHLTGQISAARMPRAGYT